MKKKQLTTFIPRRTYGFQIFHIISNYIQLFLICQLVSLGSSATESHDFCNALIHPDEYIRMESNAKLNLSCDVSSLERDPYEIMPTGLQFWENRHKLQNHDYQVVNTIVTTLLNVEVKINNTYRCQRGDLADISELKEISIGGQPQKVKNFKCRSHDFKNWQCTFKSYERVSTKYMVAYQIGRAVYDCPCVKKGLEDYVCENSLSRNAYRAYKFLVIAKNCFGTRKQNFTIRILKNVVPAGLHANVTEVKATTADIYWRIETDNPALYEEPGSLPSFVLKIKYNNGNHITSKNISISRISSKLVLANLLPFNKYTVELRVRAAKSKKSPDLYKIAKISFQTLAQRPYSPPTTDIGGFFIDNNQCIHWFWKAIEPAKMNGSNFAYRGRVVRINSISREEKEIVTTAYFYQDETCEPGEFEFTVRSENSQGSSIEGKPLRVFVLTGEKSEVFPAPYDIKTIHNDSYYQLDWKISELAPQLNLIDFTISTCSSKFQVSSLEFCEDSIDFIHVNRNRRRLLLPYDLKKHLTFAISANYKNGSSGMVMTHCIPNENFAFSPLLPRSHTINSTALSIEWTLQCEERALVKGYIFTYCIVNDTTDKCGDSVKNITVMSENTTTYVLDGLKPFTNYSLQVALLARHRQGPSSVPLRQQTAEGESSAPKCIQVSNITTKSAELMWEEPELPNGIIRYYVIFINGKLLKDYEVESRNKFYSYVIDGLQSYNNYAIQVAAITVWDSKKILGRLSDPIEFRTTPGEPDVIDSGEVTMDNNLLQISWKTPVHVGGPLEFLIYEVKQCLNDECLIEATQANNLSIPFSCLDEQRIKIFIRAIQAPLDSDPDQNDVEKNQKKVSNRINGWKNSTAYYGKWTLIHDIYSYCALKTQPFLLIISFVTLSMVLLSFILFKVFMSMKSIKLVVPQGLHDILESPSTEVTLPNKSNEFKHLLVLKSLNIPNQKQTMEADSNVKSSEDSKDTEIQNTGYMPMKSYLDEKNISSKIDSVINIAVQIQNNHLKNCSTTTQIEMHSSISKPHLQKREINGSRTCVDTKRDIGRNNNKQSTCGMILNPDTGYVTMHLQDRKSDQAENVIERVSIDIRYAENGTNSYPENLSKQSTDVDASGYIKAFNGII